MITLVSHIFIIILKGSSLKLKGWWSNSVYYWCGNNNSEQQCKSDQIEYIDTIDEKTRIKLIVYAFDEDEVDDEENAKKTIIPFQLAYAVSIHKAQGLEYDSVKVVIPSVNTEK